LSRDKLRHDRRPTPLDFRPEFIPEPMKHSGRVRRAIAPKLDWMGGLTLMFRLTKQFFAASLPLAAIATFDSAALATEAKSQAVVSQKLPLRWARDLLHEGLLRRRLQRSRPNGDG
jgi:hypothetical protein